MPKCLCGKPAFYVASLPVEAGQVYGGNLRQITSEQPVCRYHADKAEKKGYRVALA